MPGLAHLKLFRLNFDAQSNWKCDGPPKSTIFCTIFTRKTFSAKFSGKRKHVENRGRFQKDNSALRFLQKSRYCMRFERCSHVETDNQVLKYLCKSHVGVKSLNVYILGHFSLLVKFAKLFTLWESQLNIWIYYLNGTTTFRPFRTILQKTQRTKTGFKHRVSGTKVRKDSPGPSPWICWSRLMELFSMNHWTGPIVKQE